MGGFLHPRDSHRSTWTACPAALLLVAAVWVQSGSCFLPTAACVCQPGPHGCAGPSVLLSTPLVESIPRLFPTARHASSSFTSGFKRGKKDSSLPQKPSTFPAAQASPPCLGCAFASEGGLNPSCHQPAAHPGPRGDLRLLQNWQPPGVTSPAHICSGTPLSAVARLTQKLLLAKWLQPGILANLEMVLKEDTGNVAHLLGNVSRALHERH